VSPSCAGYPKPSWQKVFGNPCGPNCGSSTNDGVRDIPDVSLFAADPNGFWGHFYIFCFSDPTLGVPCTGAPSGWVGAGGTSFASPIMAGVAARLLPGKDDEEDDDVSVVRNKRQRIAHMLKQQD